MRVLTMTNDEYTKVERALKHGLGNDIGMGWSGGQFDDALAVVGRAEKREPCGWSGCDKLVPEEQEYCPRHADFVERIDAIQAAGS